MEFNSLGRGHCKIKIKKMQCSCKMEKMEGEDGLRTVECLRGRLLAERVASRVAKQDADQIGTKLMELETQLTREIKSRERAEKRLKFLMKKLESLNISYISDESENLSLLEKSEISSISSTASSFYPQITFTTNCDIGEPMKKTESPLVSENLKHNVPQTTTSSQSQYTSLDEENLGSSGKPISEKSNELESSPNYDDSKKDDQSLKSSVEGKEINKENDKACDENDQACDESVDNSLALVPVDVPKEAQTIDPPIVSVKDVLDALRYAREKLQSSMERRHVNRV